MCCEMPVAEDPDLALKKLAYKENRLVMAWVQTLPLSSD